MQGTNELALDRIKKGTSPLKIALEGLSSSKPKALPGTLRAHYGFGLLIVRRLVEDNRGRLTLVSQRESITIERFQQKSTVLKRPWSGTFIGLVLDLDNPLPLEDVYAEVEKMVIPEPSSAKTSAKDEPNLPIQEEARVDLKNYGTQLLTREAGTTIRADVASLLASGKRIVVGLGGVDDITPSCADEAFGKLGEVIGFSDLRNRIKFEGGSPMAHRLIEFVLKTRQSRRSS